jgi:hypothetical protein
MDHTTGEHVVVLKDGKLDTNKDQGTEFVLGLYNPEAQASRDMAKERPPAFPKRGAS